MSAIQKWNRALYVAFVDANEVHLFLLMLYDFYSIVRINGLWCDVFSVYVYLCKRINTHEVQQRVSF